MVKKMLCSIALLAALMLVFAGLVAAQVAPSPIGSGQFLVQPQAGSLKSPLKLLPPGAPVPPSYCEDPPGTPNTCLFYGGDFDASGPNPESLYNGNTFANGTVYVPFLVAKHTVGDADKACPANSGSSDCVWGVTDLVANIQYYPSTALDGSGNGPFATDALWSISTGLVAGSLPPTPICSGTDYAPVLIFTGRTWGSLAEYTTVVTFDSTPCDISGPQTGPPTGTNTYWLTVVPEYSAGYELSYLSDAEDNGPSGVAAEAYGLPEPWDASFFLSSYFGYTDLTPTWGATGVCVSAGGVGCDRFSAGVSGTLVKK